MNFSGFIFFEILFKNIKIDLYICADVASAYVSTRGTRACIISS